MMVLFIIIILLVEIIFKPRIDAGRKNVFLWYGRYNRKYVILYSKN